MSGEDVTSGPNCNVSVQWDSPIVDVFSPGMSVTNNFLIGVITITGVNQDNTPSILSVSNPGVSSGDIVFLSQNFSSTTRYFQVIGIGGVSNGLINIRCITNTSDPPCASGEISINYIVVKNFM